MGLITLKLESRLARRDPHNYGSHVAGSDALNYEAGAGQTNEPKARRSAAVTSSGAHVICYENVFNASFEENFLDVS